MLVLSHKFPQTAPHTIANHRASERTRGYEADTAKAGILGYHCAKHEQFSTPHQAASFNALVFGAARQAALLWKCE
jgi:hypothetical protein